MTPERLAELRAELVRLRHQLEEIADAAGYDRSILGAPCNALAHNIKIALENSALGWEEVERLRAGATERSADAPEPHDGDVSRLLRIWAKPLRGLLNRPEDALALERAADVIESGGMDSVFRVSRSPTGEETHERT